MANRGRGRGTKQVGSVKPHMEDFESQFSDLASFYETSSCSSKRRKMSGSSDSKRVVKSPFKTSRSRSRHSPRKHIMPAIPLEKDFVKKRVVTSDTVRKKIETEVDKKGNQRSMAKILEKEEEDFNDNIMISPSSNSNTVDQTVLLFRDSQDRSSLGENSILRNKLSDDTRKFEADVLKKKKTEIYLKDKMLDEKKKQEETQKRIETERIFLRQDLQVLRQKLLKKENDSRLNQSPTTIEESESEEDVRENSSEKVFENSAENTVVNIAENSVRKTVKNSVENIVVKTGKKTVEKTIENSTECKPAEPIPGRRCVLNVTDKARLAVERMCLMSERSRSDVKISLLTNTDNLPEVLSGCLASLSCEVTRALPSVGGELGEMLELTESLHHFMSGWDFLLMTQTSAQVLQTINQTGDTTALATVLSLLVLAWSHQLVLTEELSSSIITNIYDLVSMRDVASVINPELVSKVFRLLSVLVCSQPQHYGALCKGGGEDIECPLHMISFLTHYCSRKEVACEALNSWLLLSQGMSPSPAWTDNSCRKCTHEVLRNLVLMTESQVERVVSQYQRLDQVRNILQPCVEALKRFQDQLGVRTWRGMFKISATICAKYVWSLHNMYRMELDSQIINKLNGLEI